MPRVDPNFICHHLNVVPKRQSPRCSSKEHTEAVKEEVDKLKCAGAIKEAFYPEWLANNHGEKEVGKVESLCRLY